MGCLLGLGIINGLDAFRYLFLCNRYRTVNLIGIFRCTLGFQLGDIIITLFLYGGSLRLEITIFAQEFLQGFLLFLFLLGGIPVFPAINICNGGIIYLQPLVCVAWPPERIYWQVVQE